MLEFILPAIVIAIIIVIAIAIQQGKKTNDIIANNLQGCHLCSFRLPVRTSGSNQPYCIFC